MPQESVQEKTAADRRYAVAVGCLVLGVAFFRVSDTVADPDLWGHVKMGQVMLETGAVAPASDPFTYLGDDHPFTNHEWLLQIVLALVWQAGGAAGLIAFKLAISLFLFGLFYTFLVRQGLEPLRAGMLVLLVVFIYLPKLGMVPATLITYLFLPLLLLLFRAAEDGRDRWLWAAPPLFVVWINLHPGVIAGVAVLLAWSAAFVGSVVYRERSARCLLADPVRTVLLATAGSLLALLVNPWGLRLPLLLVDRGLGARPELQEFIPIHPLSGSGLAYLLLLGLSAAGWLWSGRPKSVSLGVVFACMALTPLLSARHAGLFAAGATLLAGDHIADVWQSWSPAAALPPGRKSLLTGFGLAAGVLLMGLSLPHFRCIRIEPKRGWPMPARAVALLQDSGIGGRMVVFFDWGQYVMWHLGPRLQVSMDGRRETTYSDATYLQNFHFMNGQGDDWDALLRRGDPDLVLMGKQWAAYNLMKLKPGWVLVHDDEVCGLFVRDGSPLLPVLRSTPMRNKVPADGAGTCFP